MEKLMNERYTHFRFPNEAAADPPDGNRKALWRTIFALLVVIAALLSATTSYATTRVVTTTGLWSSTGTWAGGVLPVAGDDVSISSGVTVTADFYDAAKTIKYFDMDNIVIDGTLTFPASIPSGWSFNVRRDWTNNGTFNPGSSGTVNFDYSNTATVSNTITTGGSGAGKAFLNVQFSQLSSGGVTYNIVGDMNVINQFEQLSGTVSPSSYRIRVGGNWQHSGGTFNPGTGTVEFYWLYVSPSNQGTQYAQLYAASNPEFYNLEINKYRTQLGGAAGTVTLFVPIHVANNVIIAPSVTNSVLESNGNAITLKGNWTNNGTYNSSFNTVTFEGTSLQYIDGTVMTLFYDLVINNTADVSLKNTAVDVQVADQLTFTNGKLITGDGSFSGFKKVIIGDLSYYVLDGAVVGASEGAQNSWIYGKLQKLYAVNAGASSFTYDVGDANHWTPADVVGKA